MASNRPFPDHHTPNTLGTMPTTDVVTFLFTDIEGSTRLWEQDSAVMRGALASHDAALEDAIGDNGGRVFKNTGDGLLATFARPAAAILAAVGGQRALASDDWESPYRLRVRMAIHTGEAEQRQNDWFGPALNRTARMLDAAHGGQILVSAAAANLAPPLPDPIGLLDIGEHRFRDLAKPEIVHQVTHPELATDFPPLLSLEAYSTNLPIQLTPFIGRESLIERLFTDLESTRLLTLTGVGGVGKSRIATQLAADSLGRFPKGVWMVELAALADPDHVPAALSRVLSLQLEPGRTVTDTIVAHLRRSSALIIFDNCEHVIESVARLAEAILTTCPGVCLITTSREGLGVTGELLRQVPPFDVPARSTSLDAAADYDSIALFLERARAVRPDLSVPPTAMESIIDICRRLDGIALAIELAAARVRVLSVSQIASRLNDRFRLLTGGSRTALPRQRTLQATMEWSHDLLKPAEKILFRRLAAFHGGFELEAAEAVCSGTAVPEDEVLELVSRLVDESLLVTDMGDPIRYRMLETVRQYAEDRLAESEERRATRGLHAAWVARMADDAELGLRGADQMEWVNRLRAERDNIRAALAWCRDSDEHGLGLRIAGGLGRYWWIYEPGPEGLEWITEMLDHTEEEPSAERADAHRWAGLIALSTGDFDRAEALAARACELALESDSPLVHGHSVLAGGFVTQARGDVDGAATAYRSALAEYERIDEPYWASIALANLETLVRAMGEPERAQQIAESLLEKATAQGDARLSGLAHKALAVNALHRGDVAGFRHNVATALAELEGAGQQLWRAQTVLSTAHWAVVTGFPELADELIHSEAFEQMGEVPDMEAGADFVRGLDALHRGDYEEAERHLRSALSSYLDHQANESAAEVRLLLARIALARGEVDEVHTVANQVRDLADVIGSSPLRMTAHNVKALAYLDSHDTASAGQSAQAAARLAFQAHYAGDLLQSAETLAAVASADGEFGRAARLLRSAEHHRQRLHLVRTPEQQRRYEAIRLTLEAEFALESVEVCENLAGLVACCLEPARIG